MVGLDNQPVHAYVQHMYVYTLYVKVAHELEEQTLDGAGLRQLLVLKNRELRNVRKLSQYILDQRNEVMLLS